MARARKLCPVCGEELTPDMTSTGAAIWDCFRCLWGFDIDDLPLVNSMAENSAMLGNAGALG